MKIAETKCFKAALAALLFVQWIAVVNAAPMQFQPSVETRVTSRSSELVAALPRSGFAPVSVISTVRTAQKLAELRSGDSAAHEGLESAPASRCAAKIDAPHAAPLRASPAVFFNPRAPPGNA